MEYIYKVGGVCACCADGLAIIRVVFPRLARPAV